MPAIAYDYPAIAKRMKEIEEERLRDAGLLPDPLDAISWEIKIDYNPIDFGTSTEIDLTTVGSTAAGSLFDPDDDDLLITSVWT